MIARLAMLVAVVVALRPGTPLAGQSQPSADARPPQTPPFRAESELVTVDVVVVDRHGEPVRDLTAADFTVAEDGRPQSVQFFQPVVTPGAHDSSGAVGRAHVRLLDECRRAGASGALVRDLFRRRASDAGAG